MCCWLLCRWGPTSIDSGAGWDPAAVDACPPAVLAVEGRGARSTGRGSLTYREYSADRVLAADVGLGGLRGARLAAAAAARCAAAADAAPREAAELGLDGCFAAAGEFAVTDCKVAAVGSSPACTAACTAPSCDAVTSPSDDWAGIEANKFRGARVVCRISGVSRPFARRLALGSIPLRLRSLLGKRPCIGAFTPRVRSRNARPAAARGGKAVGCAILSAN